MKGRRWLQTPGGRPGARQVRFATNEMVIWSVGPEQELAVRFLRMKNNHPLNPQIRARAARVQSQYCHTLFYVCAPQPQS